jgi:large subunit ribosomal protein L20
MARAKRGFKARRRRHRIMKFAEGYSGTRSRLFRTATESVDRALAFAFRDRKRKKRDFRHLWIARINAGARVLGVSYSRLMGGLKRAKVNLDRKVLADLALNDPAAFRAVVEAARNV